MAETVEQMQQSNRSSMDVVSAFFLASDRKSARRLMRKMAALKAFGVTWTDLVAIKCLVRRCQWYKSPRSDFEFPHRITFRRGQEEQGGNFIIENSPGYGFKVQLILPGVIACTAPGFFDSDGFESEFMPPSFYD
ncbi:MAG: hypothetical protein JWN40_5997 [Phycisphaerales bacterium]|nr:hypothetical protein [Phycisphaerales bacterium]